MSDLQRNSPKQDVPTREHIAQRAYELYQQRGGAHGRDLDDWLTAERELRNQNLARVQAAPVAEEKRPAISTRPKQARSKSAAAGSTAFNNSKPFDTHTTT